MNKIWPIIPTLPISVYFNISLQNTRILRKAKLNIFYYTNLKVYGPRNLYSQSPVINYVEG